MVAMSYAPIRYLPTRPLDRPQIMFSAALFSAVVHALAIALIDFAPPQREYRYTPPVVNVDMALLEAVDEGVFDPWIETGKEALQLGGDEDYTAPDSNASQGAGGLTGKQRGEELQQTGPEETSGERGGQRLERRTSSPGQHARRIRQLRANSSLKTSETLYLNRWQRKVESVATLYFGPELASRTGRITVMVILRPTGHVEGIRILEPSQDAALNEAVVNILRASSPFPPFPAELAEQADLIEVVRVWVFGSPNIFSAESPAAADEVESP